MSVLHVTSRDNPLVQRLRRLSRDGTAYRRQAELWLEGDHLARAALDRGFIPLQAVLSESAWQQAAFRDLARRAARVVVMADALFESASGLAAPTGLGFLLPAPPAGGLRSGLPTVVLDRLQDPGNVGSILRSAAALGFGQVVALKGSVALWSPKVMRAAMGAHFALHLVESVEASALTGLDVPMIATSSHGGVEIDRAKLPWPCAWLLGHEGQGASAQLTEGATLTVQIPQPGGEESLNVAAAAAICFYESMRQARSRP